MIHNIIRHLFYVDDGSAGANDLQSALAIKADLIAAMRLGGFELSKWKSNFPELADAPVQEEKCFSMAEEEVTKVLGVSWKPQSDVFTFKFLPKKGLVASTPRQLVSIQASLYDPAGYVSPNQCMVGGRGWDSSSDADLQRDFNAWAAAIPLLEHLTIPRWWDTEETAGSGDEQLHIFCDVAATGYGVVAYHRAHGVDGSVHVTILCARSHVVPLNPSRASHHNSIPRLELAAAEKAVEVCLFVERAARKEWQYVESSSNPADYASRGIYAHEVEKWKIFHGGPAFLHKDEAEWPVAPQFDQSSLLPSAQVASLVVATPPPLATLGSAGGPPRCVAWHRSASYWRIGDRWRRASTPFQCPWHRIP